MTASITAPRLKTSPRDNGSRPVAVAAGLMLCALQSAACEPASAQSPVADRFGAVDRYVENVMREDRVPGAAVVIVHNDSVIHVQGYGADGHGRPVTPATAFVLGSMSKSFTALAIMQLVEQGRVELDAPVRRYIPWFRVNDVRASSVITVRHALNHTTGIPTRAPRASGNSISLVDHVRALRPVEPASPPGSSHEYASPNYLILGAIVEAVTGGTYAEYVRQFIFSPLRMTTSFTRQDLAIGSGMARGHRYWFGYPLPVTLPYDSDRMPTAAIISSAADLGHFLVAQLNDGQFGETSLLSPAMTRAMQTEGAIAEGFTYTAGWRVSSIGGAKAIHHGGIVPNFRGKMVMLPEQGWGVAVLTNVSSSLPLPLVPTSHRMADEIAAYLAGKPLVASPSRHRAMHMALLIAAGLIVFLQLRGLWKLHRANGLVPPTQQPSSAATVRSIAFEVAWIAFALAVLPNLLGITWRELFRASPDMAWWLTITLLLSAVTVVVRVRHLMFRRLPVAG